MFTETNLLEPPRGYAPLTDIAKGLAVDYQDLYGRWVQRRGPSPVPVVRLKEGQPRGVAEVWAEKVLAERWIVANASKLRPANPIRARLPEAYPTGFFCAHYLDHIEVWKGSAPIRVAVFEDTDGECYISHYQIAQHIPGTTPSQFTPRLRNLPPNADLLVFRKEDWKAVHLCLRRAGVAVPGQRECMTVFLTESALEHLVSEAAGAKKVNRNVYAAFLKVMRRIPSSEPVGAEPIEPDSVVSEPAFDPHESEPVSVRSEPIDDAYTTPEFDVEEEPVSEAKADQSIEHLGIGEVLEKIMEHSAEISRLTLRGHALLRDMAQAGEDQKQARDQAQKALEMLLQVQS